MSERGMRAGMEDERVRDAPRTRGLPGVRSREGGKPRMRCRVGWGVGMRMALGCGEQRSSGHAHATQVR